MCFDEQKVTENKIDSDFCPLDENFYYKQEHLFCQIPATAEIKNGGEGR